MKRATAMLAAAFLAGCGSGVHKRLLTRPDSYHKLISFPSTGNPVDIRALEREYPELKGIVMTAPEYIEEFERYKREREARGEGLLEYKIGPGATLAIEVKGEFSQTITVPPTGDWKFDFGRIRLEGRSIQELEQYLYDYFKGQGLKNPTVTINLLTGSPRTFVTSGGIETIEGSSAGEIIIMGAVSSRFFSNIPFRGGQTLASVLGMSGLPGDAEWRQIRVIRRDPVDPLRKSRIIICDFWNFLVLADRRQDIPLFPGDIVYVPQKWTLGEQFEKDWGIFTGIIDKVLYAKNLPETIKSAFMK